MINNYPDLKLGSTGNDVRILQQLLKILGIYSVSITGSFDLTTENSVKTFQEENNLKVDGIVNQETWTLLMEQTTTPSPQSNNPNLELNDTGSEVSTLQEQLRTTLYYPGEINGIYDEETENAVKRFQVNNQIIATGITDSPTWYA